jgi:hypothetical protein
LSTAVAVALRCEESFSDENLREGSVSAHTGPHQPKEAPENMSIEICDLAIAPEIPPQVQPAREA